MIDVERGGPLVLPQATILLATISAFCTTEPPANSRILPYTKPVPYCLLLASMGSSLAGVTVGSLCIAIVHRMEPLWFREVCPSSYSPSRLSDVNEGRVVGIGSDGFSTSHLDYNDHPLCPILLHHSFVVALCEWYVPSTPIYPRFLEHKLKP